jgi:S-adenosyl-L-methionine hydrolase (adenosine-forming)
MPAPILTLTTDFGLSDHYVGAMKGVILGICPRARSSTSATGEARSRSPRAPSRWRRRTAIFRADGARGGGGPRRGHARRPILVEAAGQYFVAPDNGVLSMIYAREKHKVRLISNERYFRSR